MYKLKFHEGIVISANTEYNIACPYLAFSKKSGCPRCLHPLAKEIYGRKNQIIISCCSNYKEMEKLLKRSTQERKLEDLRYLIKKIKWS